MLPAWWLRSKGSGEHSRGVGAERALRQVEHIARLEDDLMRLRLREARVHGQVDISQVELRLPVARVVEGEPDARRRVCRRGLGGFRCGRGAGVHAAKTLVAAANANATDTPSRQPGAQGRAQQQQHQQEQQQ